MAGVTSCIQAQAKGNVFLMGALFPIRFKPQPARGRKEFIYGPIRAARGEYHRGWLYIDPVFSIDYGLSRVVGVRAFAGNPKVYNGVFKRGDRILAIHFFARSPRDAFRLLVESVKILPRLKEAGYAGLYGDTTNAQLPKVIVRHAGFVIDPPAYKNVLTRIAVMLLAMWNVVPERFLTIGYGIPLSLLGGKFQRLVIRL